MKRKRDFEEKESFEKILRSNGKWMKREDNLMQMIRKEYENIITEENKIKRNWIYEKTWNDWPLLEHLGDSCHFGVF